MEEASLGRHQGGGIMEEHPGHLESIWEASGRLLEGSGRTLGVSGGSRAIWGVLGVSAHKMRTTLNPLAFVHKQC